MTSEERLATLEFINDIDADTDMIHKAVTALLEDISVSDSRNDT